MRLPKELKELAQLTDTPFQPKWEFLRMTHVVFPPFGRCYESRYRGHLIRYYKDCYCSGQNGGGIYIEKRIKLFHSRPLHIGLQCYLNVSQISSLRLSVDEWRNIFASKLHTGLKDLKCYAAETRVAQALLSRGRTAAALEKLVDLVRNLPSGRLALVDEGVMIFFSKNPDQNMLDTLHEISTALSESRLLPSERNYQTLSLGFLLAALGLFVVLTVLVIVMRREGLGLADLF